MWDIIASVAAPIVGGLLGGGSQDRAGDTAGDAQIQAAGMGIEESRRQFDRVRELLEPYATAGESALTQQMALAGLGGEKEQQKAIAMIERGPGFQEMVQQGEDALLQQASATGGLRGGNIQAALAQYRPQMLQQEIQSQYGRLGGIAQLGQASAAGVGSAGLQTGASVGNLMGQQGLARAQAALAGGRAQAGMWGDIAGGVSQFAGQGGFDKLFGGQAQPQTLTQAQMLAEQNQGF